MDRADDVGGWYFDLCRCRVSDGRSPFKAILDGGRIYRINSGTSRRGLTSPTQGLYERLRFVVVETTPERYFSEWVP